MKRCVSVIFVPFFVSFAIASVSAVNLTTVNASVPIVNEYNGIPSLFRKDWHYRNTFNVVIKNGSNVKFQLQDPNSLAKGEKFSITCLHNTVETEDMIWELSKNTPTTNQIVINTTCVPTVGVLKLRNKPAKNVVVTLTTSTENGAFQRLPIIAFTSFETYDYKKSDAEAFLKETQYYGFVSTPRAQLLIGKGDVEGLSQGNLFIDGLKIINDVIEKYDEYSGRSAVPLENGLRINKNLEKHVLLFKSQACPPGIIQSQTFNLHSTPSCVRVNTVSADPNICKTAAAYYGIDRVVILGNTILDFFAPKWVLFHEIGHHYDLYTKDEFVNVQEVWNNIYAAFYQSRFVYRNETYYWMQDSAAAGEDSADKIQQVYANQTDLRKFLHRARAHFFIALFTLDNHDASMFRSFNIRAMKNADTSRTVLKSIAISIRDQYNVNVAPFIQHVIHKGTPWLNLTDIYDLASSKNFRMPCFYYPADENTTLDPRYSYVEHYLKPITNLRLCSTIMDTEKNIEITMQNPQLINEMISLNAYRFNVTGKTTAIYSRDTVFVFWGALNTTAVILPAYAFCSPRDEYKCTVNPKILTYDEQNPSQILPHFRFDILGQGDFLIAYLGIDISNKKFTIGTLAEKPHEYFPQENGTYVAIELYNPSKSLIASYKINGTKMPIEEVSFDIGFNYTFQINAKEKNRVKVFNYTLENFASTAFKIDVFGINEVFDEQNKIMNKFADILRNDLEYKPYLKKYQHLTDLLRILKKRAPAPQ